MAESLDIGIPIAIDGYATHKFETDWFDVTLLGSIDEPLDISVRLFDNGLLSFQRKLESSRGDKGSGFSGQARD